MSFCSALPSLEAAHAEPPHSNTHTLSPFPSLTTWDQNLELTRRRRIYLNTYPVRDFVLMGAVCTNLRSLLRVNRTWLRTLIDARHFYILPHC